jgi:hypothetical protein
MELLKLVRGIFAPIQDETFQTMIRELTNG